jgi:hypothetical protein
MGFLNMKKTILGILVGVVVMLAASADVSAQSRRELERERQRIERDNARNQRSNRSYRTNTRTTRQAEQQIANSTYATGYQYGLMAGQYDRRSGKYNRSNVYRGTGAYPNQGDPTSSDYVYRQAYLQGYNDGFNGIRNY